MHSVYRTKFRNALKFLILVKTGGETEKEEREKSDRETNGGNTAIERETNKRKKRKERNKVKVPNI